MAIIKLKEYNPTHRGLVTRMALWLKNVHHATVVMSELATRAGETPDVIGWFSGAHSTLIECKVGRGDFRGDGDKYFRQFEDMGMGDERYFAAPKGLLKKDEIPKGWGFLEVDENFVREVLKSDKKPANKHHECLMLMSALRRLEISTAVFVRQDTGIEDAPKTHLATNGTKAAPVSPAPAQTAETINSEVSAAS